MSKPTPIVISLKRRVVKGAETVVVDDAKSAELVEDTAAAAPAAATPTRKRRGPDNSSSPFDISALEGHLARFQKGLEAWLSDETRKLQNLETRSKASQEALQRAGKDICHFMQESAPKAFSELGSDPSGKHFASWTLPRFLDVLEEDKHALSTLRVNLAGFAQRRFPKSNLAGLEAVELLEEVLRLLEGKQTAGGAPAKRSRRRQPEQAEKSEECEETCEEEAEEDDASGSESYSGSYSDDGEH
eukprot:TRINITY_DN66946_c0_g1_i1.p1 TRINITY_DN66946_c0_g1~~TRINITY_DN66946_c0_g1_i1.p1  ORF type:complete len:245 (+),score=76.46 TRINITY_DN66946_c0_g1_i1:63-797(+)